MSEAVIILSNMRGGCATVGNTVHALFRLSDRQRNASKEIERVKHDHREADVQSDSMACRNDK